jgi:hypothetical protein
VNGLVKLDKFAPSQRPYAFLRESFQIDQRGRATVEAIWPGRKSGVTTASFGQLGGYRLSTLDDLIENIDMRYGGYSIGKWDGERLITDQSRSMSYCNSLAEQLDMVLQAFPAVPEGWEGWYYRR